MNQLQKESQGHGMPWETEYGYAQGVKVGDTVWLSGQAGHDEQGGFGEDIESQMRLTYANIEKLLTGFGMSMGNVVDETLYVLDNSAAAEARQKLGTEVYPDRMQVASTMVGVPQLNYPFMLVEIKVVAKMFG